MTNLNRKPNTMNTERQDTTDGPTRGILLNAPRAVIQSAVETAGLVAVALAAAVGFSEGVAWLFDVDLVGVMTIVQYIPPRMAQMVLFVLGLAAAPYFLMRVAWLLGWLD